MSFEFKEKGNQLFKEADYAGAEEMYSQAIQKNPKEPSFFTNRAVTRLRLEKWTGAEQDARAAITLHGGPKAAASLKSSLYLAQALLELQHPQEAYDIAVNAYSASLSAKSPQSENLSKIVLRAKQHIWAARETARLREMNSTLASIEQLIEADLKQSLDQLNLQLSNGEIGEIGFNEDQKALREEAAKKVQNVRDAFKSASGGEIQERVVPDYLIDNITFEVMHDPVMTISGHSFDRIGITKYLEQSHVDPVTRVPMTVKDLRPNYSLKAACEDFLDKNGWAAYKYFKQGSGADFSQVREPSRVSLDFTAKPKYDAWKEVKDVPVEEARKTYIEFVAEVKAKYAE
ncbi:STIP1 homology and U-box containing protein 1 [Talaromyces islandicus]|uniref:STIP1 homology and U-box containing protein 1 n=1 Tax=Talaromyces islandicus TaxID=28573 RepID=A0A0U1LVY5_TALIS|nr:STIP1 homology and U-box containing protein 1 [Talaromyces islandicus]